MGRRSRKRVVEQVEAPAAPSAPPTAPPRTPRLRATADERPPAPWHPVPLVELCVLAGLVMIVVGFTVAPDDDRMVFLVGGFSLASVAGLEQSVREHFAGYRSHTTLLAAFAALLVAVPLWFTPLPQEAILVIALLVAAAAFRTLRQAFSRKAGGLAWRA